MKLSFFKLFFAIIISGTMIIGCESSVQKQTQIKLNRANQNLTSAKHVTYMESTKSVDDDEWRIFKNKYNTTFEINKIRIEELKEQMSKPRKVLDQLYAKQIDTLEQKNMDMKLRMDAYGSNKTNWESFKREFDRNMDELAKSLKDFKFPNKV